MHSTNPNRPLSRVFNRISVILILIVAFAGVLGPSSPSLASDQPDLVVDFPAGAACNFELSVDITGSSRVVREFVDKTGNVVRMLFAGTGSALVFTNVSTGANLSLKSNGAVRHVTFNADGSSTETDTGHNVLILFSTDKPAGPSTTLIIGSVVFTVDTFQVFTVLQISGRTTDICAALSH